MMTMSTPANQPLQTALGAGAQEGLISRDQSCSISPPRRLAMKTPKETPEGSGKGDDEIATVADDSDEELETAGKEAPKAEKSQLPRFSVTNILSPFSNLGKLFSFVKTRGNA
ncbi:unnamed protein product [Nippostrongylus brasiliensis]|uniref:PEST proteolytic signal-containing nuclear protein n=1 Tax=Nippostrongylus brasiliensis TaxID=27835 RepID=A0A0N4YMK8_NIPBR|nr:unnamed protein product [Nippostrongylus brasiliensis]